MGSRLPCYGGALAFFLALAWNGNGSSITQPDGGTCGTTGALYYQNGTIGGLTCDTMHGVLK